MNTTYLRYELLRLARNRQNMVFSLGMPVLLFLAIAAPNRHAEISPGISVPLFYMSGLLGFGTIAGMLAGGARIAIEREAGWTRQLRITPLTPRNYLRTKVLTSYVLSVVSLALLCLIGAAFGVRMSAAHWVTAIGLVLVALIPFAALGIMLGHLIRGESMGPVMGLGVSFFAILGGAYFPIGGGHGFMHDFVRLIPSFWLVQAGKISVGGQSWTVEAWIVIAAWAVALGAGATWAYRRDTRRA